MSSLFTVFNLMGGIAFILFVGSCFVTILVLTFMDNMKQMRREKEKA